jgi:hypothetical protein
MVHCQAETFRIGNKHKRCANPATVERVAKLAGTHLKVPLLFCKLHDAIAAQRQVWAYAVGIGGDTAQLFDTPSGTVVPAYRASRA